MNNKLLKYKQNHSFEYHILDWKKKVVIFFDFFGSGSRVGSGSAFLQSGFRTYQNKTDPQHWGKFETATLKKNNSSFYSDALILDARLLSGRDQPHPLSPTCPAPRRPPHPSRHSVLGGDQSPLTGTNQEDPGITPPAKLQAETGA